MPLLMALSKWPIEVQLPTEEKDEMRLDMWGKRDTENQSL